MHPPFPISASGIWRGWWCLRLVQVCGLHKEHIGIKKWRLRWWTHPRIYMWYAWCCVTLLQCASHEKCVIDLLSAHSLPWPGTVIVPAAGNQLGELFLCPLLTMESVYCKVKSMYFLLCLHPKEVQSCEGSWKTEREAWIWSDGSILRGFGFTWFRQMTRKVLAAFWTGWGGIWTLAG